MVDLLPHPTYLPGMARRPFLLTWLAGALAVPLVAEAQQTGICHVGGVLQRGLYSQAIDGLRECLPGAGTRER
jgi:hypothetical protein